MLVAPKPGFKYRDTVTKQLVPDEGLDVDPTDLDIARALECGDLEPVAAPSPKSASASSKDTV